MSGVVLALFGNRGDALAAVTDLLDAAFINVQQEQDGRDTLVIVDVGERFDEARAIVARHGGTEFARQ